MDELTMLRELWAEQGEPSAARLAPARRRLLEEARRRPQEDTRRRPQEDARRRTVVRRRVVVAAGLTLALAGSAVAVKLAGDGRPAPAVATVNAARILDRAATTATAQRWPVPRPGQYLVVNARHSGGVMAVGTQGPTLMPQPPSDEAFYYQVDGRLGAHAETFRLGHGRSRPEVTCPLSSPIEDTSYAAMATWPTDPGALRAFLLRAAPSSW